MDNLIVLLLAVICIGIFLIAWALVKNSKPQAVSVEAPVKKHSAAPRFERRNEVEGILHVNGRKIKTYNVGELCFEETVHVVFYNATNDHVLITDIILNGKSIFSFAPPSMIYRDKADYAVQVLKQTVNQGALSRSLAQEIEQVVLDVDALNELMDSGQVYQLLNDDEDFAWRK